jgi:diguanylate cyclase (GGDEF)-like protein/PAS domain S-box-containing protein
MNTSSTGSRGLPPSLRVRLALAFGALAGALAVALSLAIGHTASDAARIEISRHLTRSAAEFRDKLDAGGGALDLARVARLRAEIEADTPASGAFELLVVQSDGTVVAGPAALLGKQVPMPLGARVNAPAAIERWPDGENYLAGGSASRGNGAAPAWVSIARQRRDVAFAPVADLQRAILWAGLALALAGIAAGWLLATRLARPLEALANAADKVMAGESRAALPLLRDNLEVARLSKSLREMVSHLRGQAETLREAQDRMEQRVRERTAELVELQAQLELEIADTMVARDDAAKAREQLELALTASNLALWDYDVAGDRVFLGPTWSQMLGGPAHETHCSSRELLALVPEPERERVRDAVQKAAAGKAADYRIEHPVQRKDGGVIWIVSVGRVVEREADGRARRIVGTNRDITDRVEAQRKADALALHDPLTGLPSRRLLDDRLQVALAAARREQRPLGLLFVNLDGLAQTGSDAGNALLLELSRRARSALRETDTYARLGPQEFVAVLPGAGTDVLALPASRLLKVLSQAVEVGGRSVSVVASIGATQAATGTESPADLLARADAKKEEARLAGGNDFRIDAGATPAPAPASRPNANNEEKKR